MLSSAFLRTSTAVALLFSLPACAAVSDLFTGSKSGPARVNALVASVEQVYVDLEVSKEKASAASQLVRTIADPDFRGDALAVHAELSAAIDRSEEQSEELDGSVERMKESAEALFKQWTSDLDQFTSPEMRQRSQVRLDTTRNEYNEVLAAVEPAQTAFRAVNQSLRDHELFLANDLSRTALAAIQADVRVLGRAVGDLDRAVGAGLVAARKYVDSVSPPATQPDGGQAKAVPVAGQSDR